VHTTEPAASEADMHPYSSFHPFGQEKFWTAVADRLRPLLGDVEVVLGVEWNEEVKKFFNRADFQAIEVARSSRGRVPQWHVLEWYPCSYSISYDEDSILAGESRAECIAHLVSKCTAEGVWPDSLRYMDDGQTTEFGLIGETFAIVRPATSSKAISERVRARIDNTLLGLAKANSQCDEFTKRLARWPGLSSVVPVDSVMRDGCHWPGPSEWLISSRRLWAAAGKAEVGLSQAQELAAAVFGFKSWNQLCGLLPSTATTSSWWSMCAPYYVSESDEKAEAATAAVYQDVANAFLDFRSRVAKACSSSSFVGIDYHGSFEGHPGIRVCGAPERMSPGSKFLTHPTITHLHPVEYVSLGEDQVDRVRSILESDDEAGLRALLLIDDTAERRFAHRIQETGMQPVATDGPWSFFVSDLGRGDWDRYLVAELFRENGTKIGRVSAPLYKSEIPWSVSLNGFVLTTEYNYKRPVAIIRGLAESTVQKLRALLRHPMMSISFDEKRQYDDQYDIRDLPRNRISDFDRLVNGMTPAGVVLTDDLPAFHSNVS
jgi:hypothetical protein